jgi:hypothetical protein
MTTSELPLFMQSRPARAKDPETSQLGEDWLRRSGIHRRQLDVVREAVERNPGRTYRELAAILPFADRNVTIKRLGDLVNRGQVERGPERLCQVSRQRCMTWWPPGLVSRHAAGTLAPSGQSAAPAHRAGLPERVLTPDERRAMRRRAAAAGDPWARHYTAVSASPSPSCEGQGGEITRGHDSGDRVVSHAFFSAKNEQSSQHHGYKAMQDKDL